MPRSSWRTALVFVFAVFFASFLIALPVTILVKEPFKGSAIAPPQSLTETLSSPASGSPATPAPVSTPQKSAPEETTPPKQPSSTGNEFRYTFNVPGVLNEAPDAAHSASAYWFLNSGGRLLIQGGIGSTVLGSLPLGDRWQAAYAASNPVDTDNGAHPQNIFRLVTEQTWDNESTQLSYLIERDNLSQSPNRNASNGLLLMSRYQSGDTLYYAGIRVDGTAVIKKKYQGTYYTMAQQPYFPGLYGLSTNPDLLPHGQWLTLRMTTVTGLGGAVTVSLDLLQGARWVQLASAQDSGSYGHTPPITAAGHLGVRTDFMDVEFKDFRVTPL